MVARSSLDDNVLDILVLMCSILETSIKILKNYTDRMWADILTDN